MPGSTVDRLSERKDLGPDEYLEFVKSWIELGAEIVGGCCEIGPAHIKAISTYLAREGVTITRNIGP